MKKIVSLALGFAVVLQIPAIALGQELQNTSVENSMEDRKTVAAGAQSNKAQNRDAQLRAKRAAFTNRSETRIEQLGQTIGSEKALRTEILFGTVTAGYDSVLDTLFDVGDRLESRIDKIRRTGADTAGVTAELTLLQGDLLEIATSLEVSKALWDDLVASDNPALAFTFVRKTLGEIKDSFEATRGDLVDLNQRLKSL